MKYIKNFKIRDLGKPFCNMNTLPVAENLEDVGAICECLGATHYIDEYYFECDKAFVPSVLDNGSLFFLPLTQGTNVFAFCKPPLNLI